MRHALLFATMLTSVALATQADARPFRPGQLPAAPDGCNTCHTSGGGTPRNAFGLDVEARLEEPFSTAAVPWAELYDLDSDGDGFTNGEELGDPDGVWTTESPDPVVAATHPGDPDSAPVCGNGTLEGIEDCDGSVELTCEGVDAATPLGEVVCSDTCEIDASGCRGVMCGDGIIDAPEECDGELLADATCESLGFDSGTLACGDDCMLDMSGCETTEEVICGDGMIGAGEACDGEALGDATCESEGFISGDLSCTDACRLDTSACVETLCGNGVIDEGEACDGADHGGFECADGGEAVCTESCELDESGCTAPVCGNGVLETGEACDGESFTETCEGGGQVCTDTCEIDRSACDDGEPAPSGSSDDGGCSVTTSRVAPQGLLLALGALLLRRRRREGEVRG